MMGGLYNKYGKTFKPNEIIFCEFEPGNDFYLIQQGKVKIAKIVKNKEKTMDILGVGDIFGEMAILEEAPRSASAIAVDNVAVLHFNRDNFVSLMTSQPALAYKLMVIFARRIYDAKRRLMILLLDDIQSKVSDVFLMLAEKEPNHKEIRNIDFPVTVDDVANWCGEPIDAVQQVINHWAKVGKLEYFNDRLVVHNLNDFRRIVQSKRKFDRD
ncbi:MAG: Crp/Fnr family transcriptional regulator [Leptospiraceae bacterium]|nr:Crp/Fnr family transcriptional regulator [Leptospiraceae bacterium]MCB1199407.1 Crp/Fnr family transcriptional regulator [Leptospiraceae bacterium]